ncbi:MAG: hypothetical protein ABIQ18_27845 [Umezawaea sp.]
MSWVTLFDDDSTPTRSVRQQVEQWCKDNKVEFVFKVSNAAIKAEYNINTVPTLRYFNPITGAPRSEVQGKREIIEFLSGDRRVRAS